jgi:hypothetical protein
MFRSTGIDAVFTIGGELNEMITVLACTALASWFVILKTRDSCPVGESLDVGAASGAYTTAPPSNGSAVMVRLGALTEAS